MGKSKAKIYFFPNSLHKQKIKYHILQAYEIIAFSLYLFHGLKFPSSFYNHFPNIRMEKIKPYQNYSHFGKLIPEPITRNLTFFFKNVGGILTHCSISVTRACVFVLICIISCKYKYSIKLGFSKQFSKINFCESFD